MNKIMEENGDNKFKIPHLNEDITGKRQPTATVSLGRPRSTQIPTEMSYTTDIQQLCNHCVVTFSQFGVSQYIRYNQLNSVCGSIK
jgi:hypothetical protein